MLGRFFQTHFDLKIRNKDFLKLDHYHYYNPAVPTLYVHHDPDSDTVRENETGELRNRLRRYKNSKIIFLVRDPRDVVVSHYFQETRRPKKDPHDFFKGSISEFVRDPVKGVDAILTFCNLWASQRQIPQDFLLVRYEDLQRDTTGQLRRILEFLQIKDITEIELEEAVSFGVFENMRKLEQEGTLRSKRLRPGDVHDPESYKTRRGIAGGFYDYLSQEDIIYLNDKLRRELDPFFGYSFELDPEKIKAREILAAGSVNSCKKDNG
jgi:hypothetical protein